MSSKQTAQRLARQLRSINSLELCEVEPFLYEMNSKRRGWIKQALDDGLKLIRISVADGYALFYEARRTKAQVTFHWLYGGPDEYIPDFGGVFSVPIKAADDLIRRFDPDNLNL